MRRLSRRLDTIGNSARGSFHAHSLLVWVGLLAAIGPAAATPLEAPSHLFEGRDLFNLQWAADPRIRPDGHAVAYVRTSYDIMSDRSRQSIWLVDVDSGTQTRS